jgi:hypothetical protein
MQRIQWREEDLLVDRLVLRKRDRSEMESEALGLADDLGLDTADDTSIPQPGDFWIGCHPAGGWGDADPQRVGWVSYLELPVALFALRSSLRN